MTYDTTQPVIMARMHRLALLLTTEQTPFKVPWSSLPPLAHGLLGCLREAATAPDAPEPPWLPSALLALCGVLSACEVPEGVLALPRDALRYFARTQHTTEGQERRRQPGRLRCIGRGGSLAKTA